MDTCMDVLGMVSVIRVKSTASANKTVKENPIFSPVFSGRTKTMTTRNEVRTIGIRIAFP